FHHFTDKDALFLALASEDAEQVAELVDDHGLVEAMRRLREKDAGWLGVQLEVARRHRTDPGFLDGWQQHLRAVARATQARLARQRVARVVRYDVPVETLAAFLALVYDGLVAHLATGMPMEHLDGVLDLFDDAVRRLPARGRAGSVSKDSVSTADT